jgi:hypothetical protein
MKSYVKIVPPPCSFFSYRTGLIFGDRQGMLYYFQHALTIAFCCFLRSAWRACKKTCIFVGAVSSITLRCRVVHRGGTAFVVIALAPRLSSREGGAAFVVIASARLCLSRELRTTFVVIASAPGRLSREGGTAFVVIASAFVGNALPLVVHRPSSSSRWPLVVRRGRGVQPSLSSHQHSSATRCPLSFIGAEPNPTEPSRADPRSAKPNQIGQAEPSRALADDNDNNDDDDEGGAKTVRARQCCLPEGMVP